MKKINPFMQKEFYNIHCRCLSTPSLEANIMYCELRQGEKSEAHNHFENELFIFTSGKGSITNGNEILSISTNDCILFEKFENHIITNNSVDEPLNFYSIYWQNAEYTQEEYTPKQKPLLIFSTPPTPNGDLHLGHLSGPYLAADILQRIYNQKNIPALHATGRDDHQTYVVTRSRKDQLTTEETASKYSAAIQNTWQSYGIKINGFISPDRNGAYADFVRAGVKKLFDTGYIIEDEQLATFDSTGKYLHEAFIRGNCPFCNELCDGNACEACGRPNECSDLLNARASLNNDKPILLLKKRLYFTLSKFNEELKQYINSASMPAHVTNLALGMIEDGLPDICISHPTDWGITLNIKDFEDQIIYVWFEMAFGYMWEASKLTSIDENILEKAKYIYEQNEIVHTYGFDNSYYHVLLFPAIYIALGLKPPRIHIVNELLDLDGSKFSTSRNHLIWGKDIALELPIDYIRFSLMKYRPEGMRSNFLLPQISNDIETIFCTNLIAWLNSFKHQIINEKKIIPEPGAWLSEQKTYYNKLQMINMSYQHAQMIETFSPREIANIIEQIIQDGMHFQISQSTLFNSKFISTNNYRRTALALGAVGLRLLAQISASIMPNLSSELLKFLNLDKKAPIPNGIDIKFFPFGHQLNLNQEINLPTPPRDLADRIKNRMHS